MNKDPNLNIRDLDSDYDAAFEGFSLGADDNSDYEDAFAGFSLDPNFEIKADNNSEEEDPFAGFSLDPNFSLDNKEDDDPFAGFSLDGGNAKTKAAPSPQEKKIAAKRRKFERQMSLIGMMLIIPVFTFLTLYMLVFPKSKISQIEKRTLAKFPSFSFKSYFSSDYTADIAEWFTDTVPNRDKLKNMGYSIKSVFGLAGGEDEVIFLNNVTKKTDVPQVQNVNTENTGNPEVAETNTDDGYAHGNNGEGGLNFGDEENLGPVDIQMEGHGSIEISDAKLEGSAGRRSKHIKLGSIADTEADQKDFKAEAAEFDWSDGLVIVSQEGHYRVLGLFGYGYDTSYIEGLNAVRAELDPSINVWSMPAPLACEFYAPSNLLEYTYSCSDRYDEIAGSLDKGIQSINICPVLQKHTEEDIYLRTDHHWTQLGAYYAARTFAEYAGVPFADLSTFNSGVNEGYVGSYYGYTEDYRVLNDPEDFTYYKQKEYVECQYYDRYFDYQYDGDLYIETDTANSYIMYMGGDDKIVKVHGTANNGRTLVIIKDSYGNAEIPFYVASFDTIWVLDVRYFEPNLIDFVNYVKATDVLFSMSGYSVVGGNAENIPYLVTQAKGADIYDESLYDPDSTAYIGERTSSDE